MKTKQVNPMPAFVGTPENPCDFDCELSGDVDFRNYIIAILVDIVPESMNVGPLYGANTTLGDWEYCRPRLNNPQALPNWGWLDNPLLDGFVWEVRWFNEIAEMLYTETVNSKKCFEIATHPLHDFLHAEIKGVQKGSQLEDWAIENDVPVIGGDS